MSSPRVTHRHHVLTDQQKTTLEPVMAQALADHAKGNRWLQYTAYQRIDQALAEAGTPVDERPVMIIPLDTVEVWDLIRQALDKATPSKRDNGQKGRRLAPSDTKAGIAQRHGEEMAKVLNERQRFKRAVELLLAHLGHTPEHTKLLIEEFRVANFSSIGGTDYTKPSEVQQ